MGNKHHGVSSQKMGCQPSSANTKILCRHQLKEIWGEIFREPEAHIWEIDNVHHRDGQSIFDRNEHEI